jgi:predicted GNAT superfamily acetyltransferase
MPEINEQDNSKRKFKYVVSKVDADNRQAIADKLNEFAGHGYRVIDQRLNEDGSYVFITFERPFTAPAEAPAEE